jgi:starch phosphorylase
MRRFYGGRATHSGTPTTLRRALEASGTSAQKVVLNGVLNFSVLDGWWAEAYDGTNGFFASFTKRGSSAAGHSKQPQLPITRLHPQELQHLGRIIAL